MTKEELIKKLEELCGNWKEQADNVLNYADGRGVFFCICELKDLIDEAEKN